MKIFDTTKLSLEIIDYLEEYSHMPIEHRALVIGKKINDFAAMRIINPMYRGQIAVPKVRIEGPLGYTSMDGETFVVSIDQKEKRLAYTSRPNCIRVVCYLGELKTNLFFMGTTDDPAKVYDKFAAMGTPVGECIRGVKKSSFLMMFGAAARGVIEWPDGDIDNE